MTCSDAAIVYMVVLLMCLTRLLLLVPVLKEIDLQAWNAPPHVSRAVDIPIE